ncbi:MAG: hypothetical protein AB7G28_20025 [Pirellulales bacterium]
MNADRLSSLALFLIGLAFGALAHAILAESAPRAHAQAPAPASSPSLEQLAGEIATIQGKLPSQSHTMQDVSYHFANLWFAGQHENWPLAEFYWEETLSHMHWAVRVIPVRKDTKGHDVELAPILEGFENGPFRHLHVAIAAKDKAEFEHQYRTSLEICYGCHKAADKPYLRPQIPERPESPIINFDPNATWPSG